MSDKRRRRRQNSEGSEHSESDEKESKDGVEEVDLDKDEGVVSWLLLAGRSFWVSAPPGSHLGKNLLSYRNYLHWPGLTSSTENKATVEQLTSGFIINC